VWVDEDRSKTASTAKDGCISFKVAKGYRVIHVVASGMTVERPYQVVKAKLHEFIINLVWERRQEYVSRALERQVDDAEQYMTRKSTGSFKAVSPSSSAVVPAADGDIVDLVPAAAPRRPSAPAAAPPATAARATATAPQRPARVTSSKSGQVPLPPPPAAPAVEEVPLDLDMSGEVPIAPVPAAAPPSRKPKR
jgi:hypothetical protein